jgi:hypothetical protein
MADYSATAIANGKHGALRTFDRMGAALCACDCAAASRKEGGSTMRMLLTVEIPHEPFNSLVRNGKAGEIIGHILESIKPESAYFTEQDGTRGAVFVVNVNSPADIPSFAEPFFLAFQANCKFRIAMTPDDLQKAGLKALGETWG